MKQPKLWRSGARRLRSAGCLSGTYDSPSPFGQTSRHSGKPPGGALATATRSLSRRPRTRWASGKRRRALRPVRRAQFRRGFCCCRRRTVRRSRRRPPLAHRVRGLSIGGLIRFSRVTWSRELSSVGGRTSSARLVGGTSPPTRRPGAPSPRVPPLGACRARRAIARRGERYRCGVGSGQTCRRCATSPAPRRLELGRNFNASKRRARIVGRAKVSASARPRLPSGRRAAAQGAAVN